MLSFSPFFLSRYIINNMISSNNNNNTNHTMRHRRITTRQLACAQVILGPSNILGTDGTQTSTNPPAPPTQTNIIPWFSESVTPPPRGRTHHHTYTSTYITTKNSLFFHPPLSLFRVSLCLSLSICLAGTPAPASAYSSHHSRASLIACRNTNTSASPTIALIVFFS